MDLSVLPVDVFIKEITYLPFDKVITICQFNSKSHKYCTSNDYNNHWKQLIDNTFSSIDSYKDKLHLIWKDLGYNNDKYDYLVYTQLIKYLDPITQLIIYYRQGDMKSFNSYNKEQQFLALFLLGKKDIIENYLPNKNYRVFINLLNKQKIPKDILNNMLVEMAKEGSLRGVKYFQYIGADMNDKALRLASKYGHLDVVKFLHKEGADIHSNNGYALQLASSNGHLDVVKYLVKNGADIHVINDWALQLAKNNDHLDVVKYLKSLK